MKKRYLLWILPFLLMASCSIDDDRIFDENSVERLQKMIDECAAELVKPEYGWKMVFVPNPEKFGGYSVLMNFEGPETVRIYTDFLEEESVSTYAFNGSQGPILAFDSYSCLHYLADPKNEPKGVGKEGEFEFVIHKITPDSLVFTGKKYGNRIVFYPASSSDWDMIAQYRANIEKLKPEDYSPYFRGLTLNQTAVNIVYNPDNRSISYSYTDEATKQLYTGWTGVYGTEAGVRFSPRIEVDGVVLDELQYNPVTKVFESHTPGVIGHLKYSHHPPFPFYNSVDLLKSGSNIAALPAMPRINANNIFQLLNILGYGSYMTEELNTNFIAFITSGLRQFRLTWELEYNNRKEGPWITYFGGKNLFDTLDYSVDYRLEMSYLRAEGDQIKFTGTTDFRTTNEIFKDNMEKQPGFEAFWKFFTDPDGFTVVPESNRVFAFVNRKDSRRWIKLTKE